MLLRDPYALNAVCTSIVKCLLQLSEHCKLPRVNFRMISACIGARSIDHSTRMLATLVLA